MNVKDKNMNRFSLKNIQPLYFHFYTLHLSKFHDKSNSHEKNNNNIVENIRTCVTVHSIKTYQIRKHFIGKMYHRHILYEVSNCTQLKVSWKDDRFFFQ